MINYLLRRLILLPITLFFIVLVNFIIVNLAPGEPVTISEVSMQGAARQADRSVAFGCDERYLAFREFYGLTLPIIINVWPFTSLETVKSTLWTLVHHKMAENQPEMSLKDYDALRLSFGDRARFIMPQLLNVIADPSTSSEIRILASYFFARGGSRAAFIGPGLTDEQMEYNRKVAQDTSQLRSLVLQPSDSQEEVRQKVGQMQEWYQKNADFYHFQPSLTEKWKMLFFETRFFRYMSRVVKLDFGTLRNDPNKTVVSEVTRRFKYSLTLSLLPMVITFVFCQIFGFIMAYKQGRLPDLTLNVIFLTLYAIPIFVVAPFLIEIALNHTFPFSGDPIPISGFTSPDAIYNQETSYQRVLDVLQHIFLPIIAIMYGTLAAQSRLARTAVLEVLHQDYVRTARAKGLSPFQVLYKHVGRNAGITVITSIAGSLGIVLGGSLIVETLFGINGFGKFFYDAVVNRDYNVIMFSALAGSALTLLGYLAADIAYTVLDPRVTLE